MKLVVLLSLSPEKYTGASEASSKWVVKTKNYSTISKKWVSKRPFSIKMKQKSGWARPHPAYPTPTRLRMLKILKKIKETYDGFKQLWPLDPCP